MTNAWSTEFVIDPDPNPRFLATLTAATDDSPADLDIQVRVKWDFGAIARPRRKQQALVSAFKKGVEQYWSRQFTLQVNSPVLGFYRVTPRISIHDPDVECPGCEQCTGLISIQHRRLFHFAVKPRLYPGVSFVEANHQCSFKRGAILESENGPLNRLAYHIGFATRNRGALPRRMEIIRSARSRVHTPETFSFEPLQANLQNVELALAQQYGARLKAAELTLPALPLCITGFHDSSQQEDATIALARANHLRNLLMQAGTTRELRTTVGDSRNSAEVAITLDDSFLHDYTRLQVGNFPIALHEFGHMLGLDDEYENTKTRTWLGEARSAGVDVPPFQLNTASLMSMGDRLLPFHYMPIRAALLKIEEQLKREHYPDDAPPGQVANITIAQEDTQWTDGMVSIERMNDEIIEHLSPEPNP